MKKYRCEVCRHRYLGTDDRSNFRRHCRSASHKRLLYNLCKPVKVWKCQTCNREFFRSDHYKKHRETVMKVDGDAKWNDSSHVSTVHPS